MGFWGDLFSLEDKSDELIGIVEDKCNEAVRDTIRGILGMIKEHRSLLGDKIMLDSLDVTLTELLTKKGKLVNRIR